MKKLSLAGFFRSLFFLIVKIVLIPYTKIFHHIRFNKNGYKIPKKTPAVFVSNHQSNWDGVYVNLMFFGKIIRFLVHDELFKYRLSNFFFSNVLGMVKRANKKSDIAVIKHIFDLKKEGCNIGIYPEGDIDFWGRLIPISTATAKLCKKLGMPLVLMNISGAHLRVPRWAKKPARSKIEYKIVEVLQPEQLKTMSVEEIHEHIINAIGYDENEYQAQRRIKLKERVSHAQSLELGLYVCPVCGKYNTLKSKDDEIFCQECGMSAKMNLYDELTDYSFNVPDDKKFSCPALWNDWQSVCLKEKLDEANPDEAIFEDVDMKMQDIREDDDFKKDCNEKTGSIKLFTDKLTFESNDKTQTFDIKKMTHILLQFKSVIEFCYEERKYRIMRNKFDFCAYMWIESLKYQNKKLTAEN